VLVLVFVIDVLVDVLVDVRNSTSCMAYMACFALHTVYIAWHDFQGIA
jgi:hypothetical protein